MGLLYKREMSRIGAFWLPEGNPAEDSMNSSYSPHPLPKKMRGVIIGLGLQ